MFSRTGNTWYKTDMSQLAGTLGGTRIISSPAECDALIASRKACVLFFWAAWHDPSKPGGQMDQVVDALALQHGPSVLLAKVGVFVV